MSIIGLLLILLITTTCFVRAKRSNKFKNNKSDEDSTSDYDGNKNQYMIFFY